MFLVYNTWAVTDIIITVKDVNDNTPVFIYPVYPESINTYFGAVSIMSIPDHPVIQVEVTNLKAFLYMWCVTWE